MGLTEIKFDDVANGILIIIVGILSYLGIQKGSGSSKKEEHEVKHVELAGAVIDNRKADEIIQALHRNTEALHRNGQLAEKIRENLEETNQELRSMVLEIIRRN